MDLTDLTRVKALAAIGDTTDDALLTRLIKQYSQGFERYLARHVERKARTEVHELRPLQRVVQLTGTPSSDPLTRVRYSADRDFSDESDLEANSEFLHYSEIGQVRLLFAASPRLSSPSAYQPGGFLEVQYVGGMATSTAEFVDLFPELAEALDQQIAYHWQRRTTPGGNVTVAGASTSFDSERGLLKTVREALDAYRVIRL